MVYACSSVGPLDHPTWVMVEVMYGVRVSTVMVRVVWSRLAIGLGLVGSGRLRLAALV